MWIEAVLPKVDIEQLVASLTPVALKLGDDGEILLFEPEGIAMVANEGLRITCKARLRWAVIGITIPATLRSLTVLIVPSIAKRADVDVLVFRVEVEHADVSGIPEFVDNKLAELVNKEMVDKQVELSWAFRKTLSHAFDLPDAVETVQSIGLVALEGRLAITEETLVLSVLFGSTVARRPADARETSLAAG